MTAAPFNPVESTFKLLDGHRSEDVVAELDDACLVDGRLQVMPSEYYARWSQNDLSLWCVQRGFYSLPTIELVDFIRQQMGDEPAIEIGAGNGALGRALGIRLTDSRQQEKSDVHELYAQLSQAVVPYGDDVEKLTALEAIEKYEPRVVVAAWVTHRYNRERHKLQGNMHGVDEGRLLQKKCLKKYIFVGHTRVHGLKPVLSLPHATHVLPCVFSRGVSEGGNVVWVWPRSRR